MERANVSDTLNTHDAAHHDGVDDPAKRDFIYIATGAAAAVGMGAVAWPLVMQMNPAADTLAAGSIEIDLSKVEEGQQLKMLWRGKPVFVRHRTPKEIATAQALDTTDLRDPASDESRFIPNFKGELDPRFLVMIGVCTHFGCIPVGEAGDFDGWYCPCHGSHYDTAGRIRKGPAPRNLDLPPYTYISDTIIKVG
jgi:ubiquinol-cytochrome c reductase iron-sulfur subunit